jgi:hypothetical protein
LIPTSVALGLAALVGSALLVRRAATTTQRAAIYCTSAGGAATGALLALTEAGRHLDASGWLFATSLGLGLLARFARPPHPPPTPQEHPLP